MYLWKCLIIKEKIIWHLIKKKSALGSYVFEESERKLSQVTCHMIGDYVRQQHNYRYCECDGRKMGNKLSS